MAHMIKRISRKIPAFDCTRNPCGRNGCGVDPGKSHGIHCEEWIYAVVGPDVAVELLVFSGVWTPSVPQSMVDRMRDGEKYPWGVQLTTHARFPTEVDQLKSIVSRECHLLGSCRYSETTTVKYSDQFVEDVFDDASGFEQPESFWLEFEKYLRKETDRVETERVDVKFDVCGTCKGKGVVPR
jgi:hypothetical protein